MSDLAERLEALAERNSEPLDPRSYDDETALEKFLELVSDGYISREAAALLGRTGSWFRCRRRLESVHYDADFALRYEEIQEEHKEALLGRLQKAGIEEALRGNARLIEKWLMVLNSPGWEQFRPQITNEINIEQVQMILTNIPLEILQQERDAILAKQKAIEA